MFYRVRHCWFYRSYAALCRGHPWPPGSVLAYQKPLQLAQPPHAQSAIPLPAGCRHGHIPQ
ncbi:hypothetical protein AtDm6_0038 [Acetobacter tropicalis]|uniref:Uncharacterized protein n=1 Tax=Acetobacter tropicalis TaxID=104102 RepID=A0A094Z164_9PROT|nr:hypothetical protein AtDm6_0038 [Acetobacter tropicalis]